MIAKEIFDMAKETLPGQSRSPTTAEVAGLFKVYCGEEIPDNVREAILLTTNSHNREDVEENIKIWNQTAQSIIPREQKVQIGRIFALDNIKAAISERGQGLVDTSELIELNLRIALLNEIRQNIETLA